MKSIEARKTAEGKWVTAGSVQEAIPVMLEFLGDAALHGDLTDDQYKYMEDVAYLGRVMKRLLSLNITGKVKDE